MDIKDPFALGMFLAIPEEILLAIEGEHSRTDSRRQAVLDLWLEWKPLEATWSMLAKAIGRMRQHHGLSRRILSRINKKEEGD